jgi:hypothetical protein
MGNAASAGHEEGFTARPPTIDEGMRRWYAACSCCLSDAYPKVKQALDEEKKRSKGGQDQDPSSS